MTSSPPEEPGSPFDRTEPDPSSSPPSPSRDVAIPDDSRRRSSTVSTSQSQSRFKSVTSKILDANPPPGMWHATGHIASKAPTLADIRRGSFGHSGWTAEGQTNRSRTNSASSRAGLARGRSERESRARDEIPETPDEEHHHHQQHHILRSDAKRARVSKESTGHIEGKKRLTTDTDKVIADTLTHAAIEARVHDVEKGAAAAPTTSPDMDGVYPNGYKFPPKHTWGQATMIALKGFWRFVLTPAGFLITLYGLNVVAWGGMLFLLLLPGAAPAMCHPSCNDINSPRRKWIEVDSQILNALFCVTGFGLAPWRFRDLYYLLKWRLAKRADALRVLAGIHRGWFRLPGSDLLPIPATDTDSDQDSHALPLPLSKAPDPPLTGTRAPPTRPWKLDFVVWMYVMNTFLQVVLCGFMWGLNRYDRPSWSTGTFVALASIVAAAAGLMVFLEGKRVKAVEGVPVSEDDLKIQRDLDTELHGGRGRTK